jgi:hypothetical protein
MVGTLTAMVKKRKPIDDLIDAHVWMRAVAKRRGKQHRRFAKQPKTDEPGANESNRKSLDSAMVPAQGFVGGDNYRKTALTLLVSD